MAIAREVGGQYKHVFLARAYEVLADALAVGPASALNGIPVLLTPTHNLCDVTLNALKEFGVTHVTIIGGEGAISKTVENQLKNYNVNRISGAEREDTALAIADEYFKSSVGAVMANGYVYADALVGGYLGAYFGAPILLTNANTISDRVISHLREQTTAAFVLGGLAPISEPVYNKIKSAVSATTALTKVTITGKTIAGSELTASVEPVGAKVTYQWKRLQTSPQLILTDISGATASKYTTVEEDIGWMIMVEAKGVGKYQGTKSTNTSKITRAVIVEPEFAGGTGTILDPYQVATAKHLDNVRNHLSSHFIQTANIDLGVAPWNVGEGWKPIWKKETSIPSLAFKGSYNGNFYKITGLTINRPEVDHQGLFGVVYSTGHLANIGLENINIEGDSRIGGLVAENSGTIEKCYATGSVSGIVLVGGLVGFNTATITESYSNTIVKGKGSPTGGLAGSNIGTIMNSYATGSVDGMPNIGGLVGTNVDGIIKNSYATGLSSGVGLNRGGLIGVKSQGTFSNSYFDKDVTIVRDESEGRTTQEMTTKSTFTNWDFDTIWSINGSPASYPYLKWQNSNNIPFSKPEFAGGIGTEASPYKVSNLIQLHRVRYHLDQHFIQTADIKMEGVYGVWEWEPIIYFSGSFNGNGKKIQDLRIENNNEKAHALFSITTKTSRLSNIELTNVFIKGGSYMGSLVTTNLGTIENCKAQGSIIGDGTTNTTVLGGLMHTNQGTVNGCSTDIWLSQGGVYTGGLVGINKGLISNSSATGAVDGINSTGGLIGSNWGTVDTSYATGLVWASGVDTGGLIGENRGFIRNTYAKGEVVGLNNVGGLVGRSDEFNSEGKNAYINLSYATGKVTVTNSVGNNYVAGIVGYNDGWVQYCYYDKDTTGRNDSGKGIPKTTAEMKKQSTFQNWDFTNTWQINTTPASYPYFQWQGTN